VKPIIEKIEVKNHVVMFLLEEQLEVGSVRPNPNTQVND
jgi:hypothetical protein